MHIDIGRVNEYKFAAKAMEKGLIIAFPCSESLPYDFLVDNGNKVFKVQVKSTDSPEVGRDNCYRVNVARSNDEAYKEGDFDLMVIFVSQEDSWYVIPARFIKTKKIRIYTDDKVVSKRAIAYSVFKEAWEYFDERG